MWSFGRFSTAQSNLMTPDWFTEIIARSAIHRAAAAAQLVAQLGSAGSFRDPSLVHAGDPPWAESLMFLRAVGFQRLDVQPVGTWLAGKSLSHQLQPAVRSADRSPPRQHLVARWQYSPHAVFLPRDMRLLLVKDFRLFRRDPIQWSQFLIFFGLLGAVLRQHSPVQIQLQSHVAWTMIGFLESGGRRVDSVDVHDAIHLSDDQPGRAAALDFGTAAHSPRRHFVVEVFVRRPSARWSLHRLDSVERFHAANCRTADCRFASSFVRRAVLGLSAIAVGLGREDARPAVARHHPRKLPPVWRHAEPGD